LGIQPLCGTPKHGTTDETICEKIHGNKVESKPVSKPTASTSGFVSYCFLPLRTDASKSTCTLKVFYRPWSIVPLKDLEVEFTSNQLTPKVIKERWVWLFDLLDRLQAVCDLCLPKQRVFSVTCFLLS